VSTCPRFHVSSRNSLLQVAGIGPAYTDYRQLIIDNDLTGNFVAMNSDSALTCALEEIGVTKKLHAHRIVVVLMLLKSGDEAVLAAASSLPSI
jgi:hypothetical protein